MKVVIFGATGMVGNSVLHECLDDPRIDTVVTVGRNASIATDAKVIDVVHRDLLNLTAVESDLAGSDACFFCLGVSSAGMDEPDYTRITRDITLSAATTLSRLNAQTVFVYVSGESADSTETSRTMWKRVRGGVENALLALPLNVYIFRPGFIRPRPGSPSKTWWYKAFYQISVPLYPLLKRILPGSVTTSENIGKAMIALAVNTPDLPDRVLHSDGINALASA
ncbi:NAD(P)H-binding protein [Rhodococcus sp. IEGM 1379]|uniref:NAD(P)H-binding protein n=1 Tax=Rhodococcus sp. IEGM 1379 TaxID=3047086 RepID=UPI0024B760BC|nr:NAD(P)H-binding protein [Rhodococcus sp. IEGM 1379]MDI9919095.1 NAD(P)H-binding protein [Rhodococcus sp. IEGM 1379]